MNYGSVVFLFNRRKKSVEKSKKIEYTVNISKKYG